jgi:hypothetical protein
MRDKKLQNTLKKCNYAIEIEAQTEFYVVQIWHVDAEYCLFDLCDVHCFGSWSEAYAFALRYSAQLRSSIEGGLRA